MGALTSSHHKRDAEFKSSPPSDSRYANGHPHTSKKLKSSSWYSTLMAPKESSVSRLSRYPQVTPIFREIHAPCRVLKGFTGNSKRLDSSRSENIRRKRDIFGNWMGNFFRSWYNSVKKAVAGSRKLVKFKKEDVIDVDDAQTVNDDNAASEDSGVEEISMVEDEREDINKSGELQDIISKFRKLDQETEENISFQPSTSSEVVSQPRDRKTLDTLYLNQPDDSEVDASLPYHKKLLNDSAKKHDPSLRRLRYEIKLLEQKKASYEQLHPAKKEEDAVIEPFRPLTEDEKEMVANAFSNSSRRKVLVTHENSNITVTGEVLQCLRPGAWLNDEVINVYLELLKERENKEPEKFLKCHFFNTFFYKKLVSGNIGYDYKSVRRWTTQRKLGYSLLECDKIFVPVHKETHWCLAVINKKEEKFQYLDSLGGVDKQVMRALAKYIVDEVKDKNGEDIDVSSWKQEYVKDLPKQENGFDCGVFMIKYADFYSRGVDLCFKQEHMPYFRLRTAKEILRLRAD
ncbi:hypothetical protein L1887_29651 [Cichorium endivia]|nr:hypothetical protein L1887_29651 [Cichorium endivia]